MSRPHTVVITEDDPQFRLTLKACLEHSGSVVVETGDGLEGLEAFTRARPDSVLTDLRMPVLNGFGVISASKRHGPTTPVIAFTAPETGERQRTHSALGHGGACPNKWKT